MQIISKAMGDFLTNCYIISNNNEEIIIDPGVGASDWVLKNVKNPVAIFNTHGHFDHIWSNKELQDKLEIPIYCPQDDIFMLSYDPFSMGLIPSKADYEVSPDEIIQLMGLSFKFWHFPGHTPGCSCIEVEDILFSGDFLFKNSIGRVDFPFSDASKMKESLQKCMKINKNLKIYAGHGEESTLEKEKINIPNWIAML